MAYTTIDNPELYFQVKLYTGDSSTQSITFDGDTDMQPDLVWIKSRDDSFAHQVHDSVRGASAGYLSTDGTGTEQSTYPISSFDSDGWTTKSGGTDGQNKSGDAYVCWNCFNCRNAKRTFRGYSNSCVFHCSIFIDYFFGRRNLR